MPSEAPGRASEASGKALEVSHASETKHYKRPLQILLTTYKKNSEKRPTILFQLNFRQIGF